MIFCCNTTDLSSDMSVGVEGNSSDTDEVGFGNVISNAAKAARPKPIADLTKTLILKLHIKLTDN